MASMLEDTPGLQRPYVFLPATSPPCSQFGIAEWVNAVTYLEIVGIIIGQVLVGIEGDWIGREYSPVTFV